MDNDQDRLSDCEKEEIIDDAADSYSYTGHTNCHTVPEFLVQQAKQFRQLNLSHNGINDLKNIAIFVNLEILNLDNNEISDSTLFPVLPKLHSLTLNNNKIKYLQIFISRLAKHCLSLTYLSLLGNEACPHEILDSNKTEKDYENYRIFVASRLSKLKFLDWKPISNQEREKGAQAFPITPRERYPSIKTQESCQGLPQIAEEPPAVVKPANFYGHVRYKYGGKQSEGNRFIRNNDL
ncbi:leucine-rich melanocyte differentiation-associated protein [Ciona intestinalis]